MHQTMVKQNVRKIAKKIAKCHFEKVRCEM